MPTTTTAYRNDSRVKPHGNGFEVTRDGQTFYVLHTDVFSWTICQGPNLDFVHFEGHGLAIGIDTADNAIGALIGAPR